MRKLMEKMSKNYELQNDKSKLSNFEQYTSGEDGKEKAEEPPQKKKRLKEKLKILLPHVLLTAVLFGYIAGGAAVILWLEKRASEKQDSKSDNQQENIDALVMQITKSTAYMCESASTTFEQCGSLAEEISQLLRHLKQRCKMAAAQPQMPMWSYRMAFLYALTVITTTGYDQVSPSSTAGQWFTIMFALVGIPLSLLTIANFGTFLSEMIRWFDSYRWRIFQYIQSRRPFQRRWKSESHSHFISGSTSPEDWNLNTEVKMKPPLRRRVLQILCFILIAYFGLIISYCFFSSIIFNLFEQNWTLIHGIFFSFNTITTIGLGSVRLDSDTYIIFILIHNVIGLTLLTMCVNFAGVYLRMLFIKLHYFGRKIRDFRMAIDSMSAEMADAVRLVIKLMKIKASKGVVTLEDIQQLLESVRNIPVTPTKPYIPEDVAIIPYADDTYQLL
ncbi:Uncoordinated protein 58 [Trichinella pseudospiralis]|uniref:Uncoordinated protein 58 n=3 Tax=Trichinella pseudospiralis TaxID=6337 RepID=A0A0V1IJU8_TRIPS|nr:Uncoordinated protein 58 [Trichinella pseudospiralis]KRY83129.1 Uncoordinated protein 58 [Trichinella pseudospiralis]KRZ22992.1 Uncoordinated protein 58 [Trichinella pseudospiralis]KRZ36564.1 Uncoordinated protein 58 [Trichinella pseudospiralis]